MRNLRILSTTLMSMRYFVQGYYSVYGGVTGQFPMYGTGASGLLSGAAAAAAFYPYLNFGEGSGGATTGYTPASQGYGVQYPHHLFPYSATVNTTAGYPAQHFANPISLAHTAPMQSGLYIITASLTFLFF